jgi:L-ascorbate metabolism protein UlaG (beta-lactamase superfamily)
MRLTKLGHACVRVEHDGQTLVIDPGGFTEPDATEGVDAVLITHEHFDHFSEERLLAAAEDNPALRVWTSKTVADRLARLGSRVTTVGHGDTFTAAGIDIEAHGTWHAEVHPDIPRVLNTGFLLDGALFHPGDALTVPGTPVGTLLLPVHAPWSASGQLIDYVRAVAPQRAYAIHDGALNDIGVAMLGGLLGDHGPGIGAPYTRLTSGASTDLPG